MSHDLAPGERAPIPLRPLETGVGRAAAAPYANLPRALSSLIGRDVDVAAARALLSERRPRLVTLTGPGGVGKTRLAMRIADEVVSLFADGALFVPLAPITNPDLVLPAIARECALRETGAQTVADLLVNHLRHRQMLLILDNVEQVLGAVPLVAALLSDCRGLTVLATSRARLHISGEHCFPVSPLPVPESVSSGGDLSLAAVAASPAVQLFVERARGIEPRFTLSEGNAQAVAAICRRLDGLPLAIELAAVRMQLLNPVELLAYLEPALPLLTDGPLDAPDRLRTMRKAIAWSYDLLTPPEQVLLRRLSVFVGGCTLEAAEWVGGRPGECDATSDLRPPTSDSSSALESVATLVDASLMQRPKASAEPRLTMLETIREFALEQLAASGEHKAIAARHAAWYVPLAETVRRSGALSRQEGLDRLEAEFPNFRAALTWFLANGRADAALHLVGNLAEFWLRRGHLAEGIAWLERALAADTGPATAARANALVGLSMLHWGQAQHADGPGSFAATLRLLEEAEATARAAGDAGALAYTRLHQGYVAYFRGDLDLAEERGAESIVTAAAIPQGFSLNGVNWLLAEVALAQGDDARSSERFTRLLELARAGGDEISLTNAIAGLAVLAARRGDVVASLRGFAEATTVCRASGDRLHAVRCLEQAAETAATIGQATAVVRLSAAADALSVVEGMGPVRMADRHHRRLERVLATMRATLGGESFAAHWAAGAMLSLDQAIAEINALAAQVERATPADLAARSAAFDLQLRDERIIPVARAVSATLGDRRRSDDDPTRDAPLTAREHEVLLLLADGLSDKAIGLVLGISRRTASQHVAAILAKLGAESRTAAVSRALREELLGSSSAADA